jgi:hypothetical protein
VSVADDRLAAFPWVLFLLTWLIGFSVQHRMDAPAVLLDGGLSSSDLAQGAHSGDIHYQMTVVILGVIGAVLLFRRRECLQFTGVIAGLLLTVDLCTGIESQGPA